MTYNVTYQETTTVSRTIDADSEEQADELFREMIANGEIDFSNVTIVDSDVYVSKVTGREQ